MFPNPSHLTPIPASLPACLRAASSIHIQFRSQKNEIALFVPIRFARNESSTCSKPGPFFHGFLLKTSASLPQYSDKITPISLPFQGDSQWT